MDFLRNTPQIVSETKKVNKYKEDKQTKSSRKGLEVPTPNPAIEKKLLAKFVDFGTISYFWLMVSVAQLVRALGCGPRGRGFEPLHSPQ
jgi:hypothetical protein